MALASVKHEAFLPSFLNKSVLHIQYLLPSKACADDFNRPVQMMSEALDDIKIKAITMSRCSSAASHAILDFARTELPAW